MKKALKRVLSLSLAMLLMIGALVAVPTEAKADEEGYDIFLAYGGDAAESNDWGFQYCGDGCADNKGEVTATNAKIKVGETVEIGLTFPSEVVYTWFMAPVIVASEVTELDYTLNSVKVDGKEIKDTIDLTLRAEGPWWYEDTGAYEDSTALRLAGGYNEWAEKYIAESPKGCKEIVYSITLNSLTIGGEKVEASGSSDGAFDPAGKYNAYIGIQTPTFSFRNAWDDGDYGKNSDVFNQITKWVDNVATNWGATINDTTVEGNGTYTVSIENLPADFASDFTTQDYFNLLFISTDIPLSEEVAVTDVKLIMDGKTVHEYKEAYLDPDATDYVKILIQNIWNDDVKEISYYAIPSKSIEMQFTISGFNYDKAADKTDDKSDVQTPSDDKTTPDTQTGSANAGNDNGGISPVVVVAVIVVIAAVAVAVVVVMKKKKA